MIKESELTGKGCAKIRRDRGMTQSEFWAVAHASKQNGSKYENGHVPLPDDIRRLMWIHYVIGIPVDGTAEELTTIAALARDGVSAVAKLRQAADGANSASEVLAALSASARQAGEAMSSITTSIADTEEQRDGQRS